MKPYQKVSIASSIILILAGISFLLIPTLDARLILYVLAFVSFASSAVLIYQAVKMKRGIDWLYAACALIFSVFLLAHESSAGRLSALVFSFYMLFCFMAFAIQTVLGFREKSREAWFNLLMSLLYGSLCFLIFHYRDNDYRLLAVYLSLYLIFQGFELGAQTLLFSKEHTTRSWAWRHWTFLPMYVVAVLPSFVVRYLLKREGVEKPAYDESKNDEPVNLRIYIHSGLSGEHMFGHMTFSYNGIMYSYGNYDVEEEHFFRTIGPGILFTVPAEIYVNNSCVVEGSDIFEFGLHITREQEEKLQKMMEDYHKETYRWYSQIEREPISIENFKKLESDYACRLSWRTGAKYRKFYTGRWKNYWILGTNCSLFASSVLSKVLPDLHLPSGISAPGEYYEFFMERYHDPRSNVVFRSFHTAKDPSTLFPVIN